MSTISQGPVTPAEIELINAHGPFNHSVWRGRGIVVSHEEGLTGRVEFLSQRVREEILRHFTAAQISKLSIADIGCYDGWLLESLSDLPFESMVGIEPRAENVERGHRVREILGIPSRVAYRQADLDTLEGNWCFDIVLCMGVLHHLESIHAGLQKLKAACKKLLILETLCLPSHHLTPDLRKDVELKDVVYRYKPHVFGITAQKYEGNYYPGSGVRHTVVNVPTADSLAMHLDALGFQTPRVLADWDDYKRALVRNQRPINAICMSVRADTAAAKQRSEPHADWIEDYERRMLTVVLPDEVALSLYQSVCKGRSADALSEECRSDGFAGDHRAVMTDATAQEILSSLNHCPVDKTRLEYAKGLFLQDKIEAAIVELRQITQRVNADWRSCYRAFYLLWRAFASLKDVDEAERYKNACLKCNPRFPRTLFDKPPPLQMLAVQ